MHARSSRRRAPRLCACWAAVAWASPVGSCGCGACLLEAQKVPQQHVQPAQPAQQQQQQKDEEKLQQEFEQEEDMEEEQ